MKLVRLLTLILVVSYLTLVAVIPVQAHAQLLRSIPEANASLAGPPAQVELFFNQGVTPGISKITVLDSNGKQVDSGDTRVDPADASHLTISLPPLGDGIYIVVWNVVSATDGHQTKGSFPFSVGKVDANALAKTATSTTGSTTTIPLGAMIIKGFLYLAAVSLTGGILFTFLVWSPSCRKAQVPEEELHMYVQFSQKLTLSALVVFTGADVLSFMVWAGQVSGFLILWPWLPGFLSLLVNTRIGILGIVRFCLVIILAGLLLPHQNRWNRWAGLAVCSLLLLTFSLESHSANEPSPFIPIVMDWLHLAAVSIWVGGLFSFLGGIKIARKLPPELRTQLSSILIPRFSALAITSTCVLVLTGIYASFLQIGTFYVLFNTSYGLALIIKLTITLFIISIAGTNLLFISPQMRKSAAQPGGNPALVKLFSGLLTGEVVLGVVILMWVGVLTNLPPAKTKTPITGIVRTTQADDLNITLNIDPGQPGINTFNAQIISDGKPVTDARYVTLQFTSLSGTVPPSAIDMANLGDGNYRLQGGYLAIPDSWDIKVIVYRPGKFDAYGDFHFDMSQP